MQKFLTSLTFLYGFAIVLLAIYSYVSYREFERSSRRRKWFPFLFAIIGIACLAFLWINFHAPLRLETFRNTDHHFIRADGFLVNKQITLGRTDTVNFPGNHFSSFQLLRDHEGRVQLRSDYAEEPVYTGNEEGYSLASPAFDGEISFGAGTLAVTIKWGEQDGARLVIGDTSFVSKKRINWGISLWNLFKDDTAFINSPHYRDAVLAEAMGQLYLLRDKFSEEEEEGLLRLFISSRIFHLVTSLRKGNETITREKMSFTREIPNGNSFAWGIGLPGKNRNHFTVRYEEEKMFSLRYRYPVSYPLTGEDRNDWSHRRITKFLCSDPADMVNMPGVFREGFMFRDNAADAGASFAPAIITYQQGETGVPLQVKAAGMSSTPIEVKEGRMLLPSRSGDFHWLFSFQDTQVWRVGDLQLSPGTWMGIIFGSLILFILLITAASAIMPVEKMSWVGQVIACVALVLLTTRFFLYWRYKSFPPYEGMDLPSMQQLNAPWNFFIIVAATVIMGLVFSGAWLRGWFSGLGRRMAGSWQRSSAKLHESFRSFGPFKVALHGNGKGLFTSSWLGLLALTAGLAWLSGFDARSCRHLAIGSILAYFLFAFIACRHSPLVKAQEVSWWKIDTGRTAHLLVSNPMKLLLSFSLLALLLFIDIGFAIVFLNFLLFNEAFFYVNNAIAGLSAGSRRNAMVFGVAGSICLVFFFANLLFAPFLFDWILRLPEAGYLVLYFLAGIAIMHAVMRIYLTSYSHPRLAGIAGTAVICTAAFFLLPKESILSRAAMTRYRIHVMTMPADQAILSAYAEGSNWRPVIRAAQNQWFINSFIDESNNPGAGTPGFRLVPHAPQTRGARYNAQATDLVASRFLLAEHGKYAVLLFVLLLLLPGTALVSFHKLYPDFSNRTNHGYPLLTTGFSLLNYLLITALLVILAATGRYIFFGQDLPFGSILSKQSILFPSIVLMLVAIIFRRVPVEYYANRKKLVPGAAIFLFFAILLFFYRPSYNRNREFNVPGLASRMDAFLELRLQPVMDYFDTSKKTRRLPFEQKDRLFSDSIRRLADAGAFGEDGPYISREIGDYARQDFKTHLNQERMIYLDLYSGRPRLEVNENYFRIEAPPHLQQAWRGNIFGDSTRYNISYWSPADARLVQERLSSFTNDPSMALDASLRLDFDDAPDDFFFTKLFLVNKGGSPITIQSCCERSVLSPGQRIQLSNPWHAIITKENGQESTLTIEPDAFMRNFFVNGSRYYVYPLSNRFIWARNLAESISSDYVDGERQGKQVAISIDRPLTDSLVQALDDMLASDAAYEKGAEYGICVADGNGRLIAMVDQVKGLARPDPNDKAGFQRVIMGEEGYVSQALLRNQIGNINLMRMNPGPGSTLKPMVFSAIASQLHLDWSRFASTGFNEKKDLFGGERVAEYDFELNVGTVSRVADFLRLSDNYYYSNVLLLGSYPKQELDMLLKEKFTRVPPEGASQWPGFSYEGSMYWLDGFENWPGYTNGSANFGMENSFTSLGLLLNFGIANRRPARTVDLFATRYDSSLLLAASSRSAFLLPEAATFDQYGEGVDRRIPYDVFASCLRGQVKGSSQVLIPPVKMLEGFGRLVSQSRNYALTLDPYARPHPFLAFDVDPSISYNDYLQLVREEILGGMSQVLVNGTAARLGPMLKKDSKYFYYAKTGTTGDDASSSKSKLLALVISKRDLTDPDFNFRDNRFYTIYFTLQNGPAKQNEAFIGRVVRMIEGAEVFERYMEGGLPW